MNIFVLDKNPVIAAEMACDKHVIKMVLESAQILSTISGGKYKPTHKNHPCTIWARSSKENYQWLTTHATALSKEYTLRYGKIHKSTEVINQAKNFDDFPSIELTEFVQAMPDKYRNKDVVKAYRNYYRGEKSGFATWKNRNPPDWWN